MMHFRYREGFLSTTHTWALKTLTELHLVMDMILITMDNFPQPAVSSALTMAIHTYGDDSNMDDSLMLILVPKNLLIVLYKIRCHSWIPTNYF